MLNLFNPALRRLAGLFALPVLAACAAPGGTADHAGHHRAAGCPADSAMHSGGGPAAGGMMGGQPGGAAMMRGQSGTAQERSSSATDMCSAYHAIQNAAPAERESMMDQQMKGMSAEMRQHHMEMMRQQCQ